MVASRIWFAPFALGSSPVRFGQNRNRYDRDGCEPGVEGHSGDDIGARDSFPVWTSGLTSSPDSRPNFDSDA